MNNDEPKYGENAMTERNPMNEDSKNTSQTLGDRPDQPKPQETGNSGSLGWIKSNEIEELKSRWTSIQAKFIDEPRISVEQADALVADTLVRIEKAFTNNRANLTGQQDISTEDLRLALQNYRSFLNRLLTI